MDTQTGRLYDEQEAREMAEKLGIEFNDRFISVENKDATKRQLETRQVSKHDNRSKLGKKFTAARYQRKRFWK